MLKILVTGGNGQLASCIKEVSSKYVETLIFSYKTSTELNITDKDSVFKELEKGEYSYCINCAAYTNVDAAEKEKNAADLVNHLGPKNLALACKKYNSVLIHISTDFVFNGMQSLPYREKDAVQPLGIYGNTKLLGEQEIINNNSKYFILRTTWLYSEFGHNFMKSMLKLGKEKEQLSIVYDQVGTPTYAKDLAEVLLLFITKKSSAYGIYHYSNEGVASWYDFAMEIFKINKVQVDVLPIRSEEYPLPAKRPSFSVLDKAKIKEELQIEIPYWKDSLGKASEALK